MTSSAPASVSTPAQTQRWHQGLTPYHWFVFSMASLAWLFDCLDQQIFNLARGPAIKALMPPGTGDEILKSLSGNATAIFIIGWATGGLIFGAVGDRIGRSKTLTLTVFLYSLFTGLSALSQNVFQFGVYRFVTGLGVGGVFGLAVALVADGLPDRSRPSALGMLQALSAVGNVTASLIGVFIGLHQANTPGAGSAWKTMFIVGALPAFACVFLQMRLKEPEKWVQARAQGRVTGVRFGSYLSLFGEARWRTNALFGMMLCVAGVIGVWGIGFFSPELVNDVIGKLLTAQGVTPEKQAGMKLMWSSVNLLMQNIGAFFGMLAFTRFSHNHGRKPVFAIASIAAILSTVALFRFLSEPWHIFVLTPVMGFCQMSLFAGFAIYLPELFPTRLRSTGTSFCYNVGRFIAATGPITLGVLQKHLADGATAALGTNATKAAITAAKLGAFRSAACWMSLVYLVGIAALPFLPETKGKPMPED
jgi:MFS family permease